MLTEPVGGRGDLGAPGTGLSMHSGTETTTALNWSPEVMEAGRKSSPRVVSNFPFQGIHRFWGKDIKTRETRGKASGKRVCCAERLGRESFSS